ncbi:hypothetical protein BKA70DRAFT_1239625 [Coprinopsis sp. MPI-PUGE-AT-0042]|nr:hypothetical protein BKA70DRAFT_1239625 [Coprinopsis sp. MPI-PUGE-AT-0042]
MEYPWLNAPLTLGISLLRLASSPYINELLECNDVTQHLRICPLSTFRRRKQPHKRGTWIINVNKSFIFKFMAYLLSEAPKDIHVAVVGIHSIGKAPSVSPAVTHEGFGRPKQLHLWHDSWGWQRPDWFHAKDAFIVCFALDKRVTYESVQEFWIPMIRVYRNSPYAPVLIVGIRRQSHGILDDGAETRKDGISSDKVLSAQRKSGFYVLSLCIWWMEWADERFNDYSHVIWVECEREFVLVFLVFL